MGGVVADETAVEILEVDSIRARVHEHAENRRIEGFADRLDVGRGRAGERVAHRDPPTLQRRASAGNHAVRAVARWFWAVGFEFWVGGAIRGIDPKNPPPALRPYSLPRTQTQNPEPKTARAAPRYSFTIVNQSRFSPLSLRKTKS